MIARGVADLEAAAVEIRQADYQVVLLDGGPNDGPTTLQPVWREWRTADGTPVSVVGLLRCLNLGRDAEACRRLGIETYLIKPVRETDLREALIRLLTPTTGSGVVRAAAEQPGSAANRRVLVVEDNAVNQMFACHLLRHHGHSPAVAGNGREALDLLSRETFDLVLMDLEMPEMDGFTAARELRRREAGSGRRLPIVALTAHVLQGFREQCLAAGMDGYLAKPVQAAELLAVLGRLCPATMPDEPDAEPTLPATVVSP